MDPRVRRRETLHSVAADAHGIASDRGVFSALLLAFGAVGAAGALVAAAVPASRGLLAVFLAFVAAIVVVLLVDKGRDARSSRRLETSEAKRAPLGAYPNESDAGRDHGGRRAA